MLVSYVSRHLFFTLAASRRKVKNSCPFGVVYHVAYHNVHVKTKQNHDVGKKEFPNSKNCDL